MVLSICEYLGGIVESKSKRLIFHANSGASGNFALQNICWQAQVRPEHANALINIQSPF